MSSGKALSLFIAVAVALVAAVPAQAAGPRVRAMVVGKSGMTVAGVESVRLDAFRHRGCRVRAGLGLGVLHELRMSFRTRGGCGSKYVFQVGGSRAFGQQGWVYKIGTRTATAGADDPSGPFGNGPIRSGSEVVWFWCRRALRCQRSLRISGPRRARPRGRLRMRIRGYDDFGRSRPIRGIGVTVAGRFARTSRSGYATFRMPRGRGVYRMRASGRGMVPAFPVGIRVR